MATVKLKFDTSIDLEAGEEIICKDVPLVRALYKKGETFKDTLISSLTLGLKGPKQNFMCNLVITNKRLAVVPYPNQKINKGKPEVFKTLSLYYNKDIKGAEAANTANDTMYSEVINAWLAVKPVKGVELRGLQFMMDMELTDEERKAIAKSMQAQAKQSSTNAQNAMKTSWSVLDVAANVSQIASKVSKEMRAEEEFQSKINIADYVPQSYIDLWRSSVKQKKYGYISILPLRDFLVWLINKCAADAK